MHRNTSPLTRERERTALLLAAVQSAAARQQEELAAFTAAVRRLHEATTDLQSRLATARRAVAGDGPKPS